MSDTVTCEWCAEDIPASLTRCPKCQGTISPPGRRVEKAPLAARPKPAPAKPKAPAGWYPHPTMADTQRYWDGEQWTDHIAPLDRATKQPKTSSQSQLVAVVILAGSVIGIVMAMQSASLLTGTGTQWTGAAIALAAGAATYVLRKSIPTWLRVISVLAALAAFANVIYLENQLDQKRQEISDLVP